MRPKTTNINPACFNEYEAADYINMSAPFLRYHRKRGFIAGKAQGPRYIRLGTSIRYLPEDLDEWLRNNRCIYPTDSRTNSISPKMR